MTAPTTTVVDRIVHHISDDPPGLPPRLPAAPMAGYALAYLDGEALAERFLVRLAQGLTRPDELYAQAGTLDAARLAGFMRRLQKYLSATMEREAGR